MRTEIPRKWKALLLAGALLAALGYQTAATASTNTAGAPGDDQYVFFRGGNSHMYEAVYDSNTWHGAFDMCSHGWGCASTAPPSVAVNPSNKDVYVIFAGNDSDIYETVNHSGHWQGLVNMCTTHHWGCGVSSQPDLGVGRDGNQYVFFRGGNNHIYTAVYDTNGWHGGFDLCNRYGWGCSSTSPLRVAVNPSNDNQYLFFLGNDGDIYEAFSVSGTPLKRWHGLINTCTSHHWGCGVSTPPDVGVGDDGNQYVFFRGGNNHMYTSVHDANGWHGGFDLCNRYGWGCSSTSPVRVAVDPSNDYQYVFFLGNDGDIYEAFSVSGTPLKGWHGLINTCTSHHWGCGVNSAPDIAVSP